MSNIRGCVSGIINDGYGERIGDMCDVSRNDSERRRELQGDGAAKFGGNERLWVGK